MKYFKQARVNSGSNDDSLKVAAAQQSPGRDGSVGGSAPPAPYCAPQTVSDLSFTLHSCQSLPEKGTGEAGEAGRGR